eukprot:TRINITY_DN18417_c0_g1_i1.p1 TRINITY_DN18417_c0_g1~~TRINITY_DN18417_c0_g1_i1.p1  ORF type:complete len:277 (+),score=62.99 TRINITY_DN18417_c0_g1_i1:79-909(+)
MDELKSRIPSPADLRKSRRLVFLLAFSNLATLVGLFAFYSKSQSLQEAALLAPPVVEGLQAVASPLPADCTPNTPFGRVQQEFLTKILGPIAQEKQEYFRWDIITRDVNFVVPFLAQHIPVDQKFSVLEVGTGMSFVAVQFANRTSAVYSISINMEEVDRANQLGIPHYRTILHNKHLPIPDDFIADGSLDYVVDINLSSFSKIWQWNVFLLMRKLKVGGHIVTQELGMKWTHNGVGTCSLSKEMLEAHQTFLGYQLEDHTRVNGVDYGVYMLKKL